VPDTSSIFTPYLERWDLTPDGEPIISRGAQLLPVRHQGEPAMLKIATETEERFGGVLMAWWDGQGAARVLQHEEGALLLERAMGTRSLAALSACGEDDQATRILCDIIAQLHVPRAKPLPDLIPLTVWFRDLEPAARAHGGPLVRAAETARDLLASPQDIVALHGDIHHDNVLDFGTRGWLAIDPKRLHGERGFDYANLFCNPDIDHPTPPVAILPARFSRRLDIAVERSGLERRRLLQWIVAWTGLSAAWWIGDGGNPEIDFRIAELANAELYR
jgi:streptomycin 6-kinase